MALRSVRFGFQPFEKYSERAFGFTKIRSPSRGSDYVHRGWISKKKSSPLALYFGPKRVRFFSFNDTEPVEIQYFACVYIIPVFNIICNIRSSF